jgi:hypothetical protein
MHVWTTAELNELYLEKRIPAIIRDHEELKKTFIASSEPDDIALLKMDDGYSQFYDAFEKRGLNGRVLFIASGAAQPPESHLANAVILNTDRLGTPGIKKIIRFILDLALSHLNRPAAVDPCECKPKEKRDEQPLEDPAAIRDLLTHLGKKNLPVTLAHEILELGEPVMAKCSCSIKELKDDMMVIHNVRHAHFLKSMKKGTDIRMFFLYQHGNRGGLARIKDITGSEAVLTIPEKLYPKKDIRIQPKKNEPVIIYVLIANEPTTSYRVIDISPRGVGFLCPRELPVGGLYNFSIMLPDPQAVVVTQGIIRHKKEASTGYQYGVEIMLHPWDADIMAKYIMKREVDIMNLLRLS